MKSLLKRRRRRWGDVVADILLMTTNLPTKSMIKRITSAHHLVRRLILLRWVKAFDNHNAKLMISWGKSISPRDIITEMITAEIRCKAIFFYPPPPPPLNDSFKYYYDFFSFLARSSMLFCFSFPTIKSTASETFLSINVKWVSFHPLLLFLFILSWLIFSLCWWYNFFGKLFFIFPLLLSFAQALCMCERTFKLCLE